MFDLYENNESRIRGNACLLLDVGCTFSRADAAQFRRFIAEELGCTVDVVLRSALAADDIARAEEEARLVYENPEVEPAFTPSIGAATAPRVTPPAAPAAPQGANR